MALYHKWDVKNNFAYVLQFFSLISDGLGGVYSSPNSAKLSCKLEVTLVCMQSGMQPKTKKPIRLPFRCKLPRFSAAPHWAALPSRLALAGLARLGCPSCLQLFSSSIFIRIGTVQCIVQSPSPNVLLFVMTFNPQPFSSSYNSYI